MRKPVWLQKDFLLVIHDELVSRYGGSGGVRDEGLLDSALGRPPNLFHYAKPDVFTLAATYAAGIIQNHPFVDGNKRTGFMSAYTFLRRNGYQLGASEADATLKTLGLAGGEIDEIAYAAWLKANSTRGNEKKAGAKSKPRTSTPVSR